MKQDELAESKYKLLSGFLMIILATILQTISSLLIGKLVFDNIAYWQIPINLTYPQIVVIIFLFSLIKSKISIKKEKDQYGFVEVIFIRAFVIGFSFLVCWIFKLVL